MSRALGALLVIVALTAPGCVPTHEAANIEGTDLQTRYPEALEESRRGEARAVAVALVLFTGWLALDLAVRRTDGRLREGAFLAGIALVAVLLGAWVVSANAGDYPQGVAYVVAASLPIWLALVAVPAGMAWVVHGRRQGPGGRGDVVWGLFHVVAGLLLTRIIFVSSIRLWTGI